MKVYFYVLLLVLISLIQISTLDKNTKNDDNQEDDEMLSNDEIDMLLFCGALLQIKLEKDAKIIDELAKKLNESNKDVAYDKLGSYILYKCYNNIKVDTAKNHFLKGFYHHEITDKDFDDYSSYHYVDYSIFKTKSDLKRSYDELYLTHKFEKALEIYNKLQNFTKEEEKKLNLNKMKNNKLKSFENNLINIPNYVKIALFIIVFGLLFGGSLYFVNSIINKPKKDKKKKKKNQ